MAREKMSSVDHAWLRMDSDCHLMMIVSVSIFRKPLALARLRALVSERLLKHRRFRQKVQLHGKGADWVDDEAFDLGHHCLELSLPGGRRGQVGDEQLQAWIGAMAMQPLDPARPLWQMQLVRNYKGTSALVTRIHHCIGDGIALVAVLLSLTDQAGGSGMVQLARPHRQRPAGSNELESNPWTPYLKPLTQGTIKAITASEKAFEMSLQSLRLGDALGDLAGIGSQVLRDALALIRMRNDSPTSLKGRPGRQKAVAWNEPLPLEEIRLLGKVLGCSINDVLLSCVAGALRQYLLARGEPTEGLEIRAMVPVNLRPAEEATQLGNKFGLVPLLLPVGIANPLQRLIEVRRRMDELKSGYQAVLAYALLGLVGNTSKALQDQVLNLFSGKSTAVMTNVPGPAAPVRMAGGEIVQTMFWVPQSGHVGLGVSILSYAGGVQFGVMSDTLLCPEPRKIVASFAPEFDKLLWAVMMMPKDLVVSGQWAATPPS